MSRVNTGELSDPRCQPDSLGKLPFQLAVSGRHIQLAEILHPLHPLMDLRLSRRQQQGDADLDLPGVPRLAVIAGTAMRMHLLRWACS